MKRISPNTLRIFSLCLFVVLCLHAMGVSAFASETSGEWRPIYDTVLRWVNFLVLVFVIVKFGKDPIKKFFASQKSEVAEEIEGIETEKKKTDERIAAMNLALSENHLRLAQIKEQIVKQGEKKKEQIVADAERQSVLMLAEVERKVERMTLEARQFLRTEMIEAAVSLVEERLPKLLTEEDNQRFVDQFLSGMASK